LSKLDRKFLKNYKSLLFVTQGVCIAFCIFSSFLGRLCSASIISKPGAHSLAALGWAFMSY